MTGETNMPKYYIWTIGCQMNKSESERLGSYLEGLGYKATSAADEADFIVLNSCVVRQSAESKVVNKLHVLRALKQRNPNLSLAVTGCLVNSRNDELYKSFPHVDHFFKPGDYPLWLEKEDAEAAACPALPLNPSPCTFVTIIQGCDNFCSYCIVPYRRGRERSRPMAEIISEVETLVRRGAKEITLLGQNVDSYGHDLPHNPDLADLLGELNGIDGLARMRFLTSHPKDMSLKLTDAVARLDKVCEQISLPVQSGDDDILKAMRRGYTVEQCRQLVAEIRNRMPEVAISTDVIVGFPSESARQFQHTFDLLADVRFDTVHVAAYSPRQGTFAAENLTDDVPPAEKKERLSRVEQLQERIATEINSQLMGKTVEVLVESRQKGKWQGRTRSGKLVFFNSKNDYLGKLAKIKVEKTSPWSLQGTVESTAR